MTPGDTERAADLLDMHPEVRDQFAELVDKRFRPMLRETLNGLADRKFAAALAEADGGALTRELDQLATTIAAEKVRALIDPDGGPTDRLVFRNLESFCTDFFFVLYARDVQGSSTTKWCPEWWRHAEAVVRLEAIWRSWEKHRRDPDDGVSTWLLYHADPHMRVLMDSEGPFKYCDGGEGHYYKETQLEGLPHTPAPTGLFDDSDSGELLPEEEGETATDWADEEFEERV